jgi:hypothetical protein
MSAASSDRTLLFGQALGTSRATAYWHWSYARA